MKTPDEHLSLDESQIAEIKAALLQADRREFATNEEVTAVLSKWSRAAKGEPNA
jgi:predicted transcriptional regulator